MEMVVDRLTGAKQHGLCPIVVLVPVLVLMMVCNAWSGCVSTFIRSKGFVNPPFTCELGIQGTSYGCYSNKSGANSWVHCGENAGEVVASHTCSDMGSYCGGYLVCCDNECAADSSNYGGIITECMLDPETNTYQQYVCSGDLNCSSCRKQACNPTHDTTLVACQENIVNGQPVSEIYKLSCQTMNGQLVTCNGKTDVSISEDGELMKVVQGTCAENGYQNGVQAGADSLGQSADCFAIINGYTCVMRDKRSGNTFKCDCDGSCDYAIRQLATGGCANPYPQETPPDSLNFGSSGSVESSADSSPSSSEGGESSPSSSGSGESSPSSSGSDTPMSDFEYDYTDYLINIQANTQYAGNQLDRLNSKADKANEYLQEIAGKDWSPIVNVQAPNVNVELNGDTAKSGKAIYDWLTDNNYSIDTMGRAKWNSWSDSIQNAIRGVLDSVGHDSVTDYADSIGGAVQGIHTALGELRDSLEDGAFGDSLDRWEGLITNNGVINGQGSNSCPAVLTRNHTWTFKTGLQDINVSVGSLGKYICTPIVGGVSVSIWTLIRVLLRAGVAITCMFWLYRVVTGTDESDSGGGD